MSEDKPSIREPLTFSQECDICYIIGDWYLKWKKHLVNYDTKTHNLGRAKEDLKNMICKIEIEDDEHD